MSFLPLLPFEIIEEVDQYISHQDRYELIKVNRTWYSTFLRLLYRTITIETYNQYKQITKRFQDTQFSDIPLGYYVQGLNIMLDELTQEELSSIQEQCPFVQAVHVDWRIWNYIAFSEDINQQPPRNHCPRPTLPSKAFDFISSYGASKLSSLTLDVYNIQNIDCRIILQETPNLRRLSLLGLNQQTQISVSFIESIHNICLYLETLLLEGYIADAYPTQGIFQVGEQQEDQEMINHPIIPVRRMKSFKLHCQYGADRYQDWLPYFGLKYPQLVSFDFNHSGSGKDIIEQCPVEVYSQFLSRCPLLTYVRWNNTAPDFRFFQQLDHQIPTNPVRIKQLEVYDNFLIPSLLTTALFESQHNILSHVTHLTIGPVPRDMVPHQLINQISKACPELRHLCLKEPHCNLANPFKIDNILDRYRKLLSLKLDHIVLRVSFDRKVPEMNDNHPLKSLEMNHCSSFDGVLSHISPRCPQLEELSLFAYTQRDRRYKVQVHMPYQRFRKVQIHGLRTENYDVERRIRFFSIKTENISTWYYMSKFDVRNHSIGRDCTYRCMEMAQEITDLKPSEVALMNQLLERPIPWIEMETHKREFLERENSTLVYDWHPKDIYDAGHVELVCQSVERLYINKKLL